QVRAGQPDERLSVEVARAERGPRRQRARRRNNRYRSERQEWFIAQAAPGHRKRADAQIEVQSADPPIRVSKRNDFQRDENVRVVLLKLCNGAREERGRQL